jgi:hypothetical protein
MEEVEELDRFEERLCQVADLESTLLSEKLPPTLNKSQAVLEILCHTGDLDYHNHVEPWIQVSSVVLLLFCCSTCI